MFFFFWFRKYNCGLSNLLSSSTTVTTSLFSNFFKFLIFREKGREGERKGEKHQCEREISIGCLPYVPQLGTKYATQACALTWNQTSDLSVCRMTPNKLCHTSQGMTTSLNAQPQTTVQALLLYQAVPCYMVEVIWKEDTVQCRTPKPPCPRFQIMAEMSYVLFSFFKNYLLYLYVYIVIISYLL